MGEGSGRRVVAAFRDADRARLALRDLAAMEVPGMEVRLLGPEELLGRAEQVAGDRPGAVMRGGDWTWAGVEKQWLNHVLLVAEGVPEAALREVHRTLRQDGAEHVEA